MSVVPGSGLQPSSRSAEFSRVEPLFVGFQKSASICVGLRVGTQTDLVLARSRHVRFRLGNDMAAQCAESEVNKITPAVKFCAPFEISLKALEHFYNRNPNKVPACFLPSVPRAKTPISMPRQR